jgi:hypothetical protein
MGQSGYLQYIMTTQIISEHLLNDSVQRIARKSVFPIESGNLQRPLQSRRLKPLRHGTIFPNSIIDDVCSQSLPLPSPHTLTLPDLLLSACHLQTATSTPHECCHISHVTRLAPLQQTPDPITPFHTFLSPRLFTQSPNLDKIDTPCPQKTLIPKNTATLEYFAGNTSTDTSSAGGDIDWPSSSSSSPKPASSSPKPDTDAEQPPSLTLSSRLLRRQATSCSRRI